MVQTCRENGLQLIEKACLGVAVKVSATQVLGDRLADRAGIGGLEPGGKIQKCPPVLGRQMDAVGGNEYR